MNLERLAAFWSSFALERELIDGAIVLENRNLPFLEVNAGYPTRPEQISRLEGWFVARGRPGVLILPEHSNLEIAASNAQFEPFGSFGTLEIVGEANFEPQVWVEQVPWSLGRAVGEVVAVSRGANAWAELISSEVARVLQSDSSVTAYLAYHGDQPVGALLEAGGSSFLWGVTRTGVTNGAARALANRAALDAGGKLEIGVLAHKTAPDGLFALLEAELEDFGLSRVLERFSVWVKP